jgi:putative transposase
MVGMPRTARIVVPDVPHHVTQRGNNRQDIFFVEDDRRVYLKLLVEQRARYRVAILGYCLMTNHVHHILVPSREKSLAAALGRTHWKYSQYVNRLHGRTGHLWQNRFYSNAMDDDHCLLAMRYVERNPIRAGICRAAGKYPWSSAAAHIAGNDPSGILDLTPWKTMARGLDWRLELEEPISDQQTLAIRRSTHTGRPLADDSFISKLEKSLGKRLRPLPLGRPVGSKKIPA